MKGREVKSMRKAIALIATATVLLPMLQTANAKICTAEPITLRRVEGIVLDDNENGPSWILPGAVVEITNGSLTARTVTDVDGYFSFGEIRPGNYEIRAELEGYLPVYGIVRVRRNSATEGQVLVLRLPISFDSCGGVGTEKFDKARRLQLARTRNPNDRD